MLRSKQGLTLLLALVFAFNWAETSLETWVQQETGLGRELSNKLAYAFHAFEGFFSFAYHDVTNIVAVKGYSISYFFIFLILMIAVPVALARRKDISPYRVLSLGLTINYLLSLPFFLFFPIPERWHYPESQAMLLSDKWSTTLIETIRPISGINNCFPSFHCSMTVLIILICYIFEVRFRTVVLALGSTIILATFVLGIHWLPDIIAGIAAAVISVMLAWHMDRALQRQQPA